MFSYSVQRCVYCVKNKTQYAVRESGDEAMKKLLIDLDICSKCKECGMLCSYIQHPGNSGITTLREFAHFAVVCRRCDDAPCVASCPWEALELQPAPYPVPFGTGRSPSEASGTRPTNMLKRHMMRCTSCKNCSGACPFGVIYPETIPFVISRCDYCIGRLRDGEVPICLQSCAPGGIKYGEFEENAEEGIFKASDHLMVKTTFKWERVEEIPPKKK